MTDQLYQYELQQYRDYRVTFTANQPGERVLADLVEKFCFNTIQIPASAMDLAKLDGSRDVIRYILGKIGLGDAQAFVRGLGMAKPRPPEHLDIEAIIDMEDR